MASLPMKEGQKVKESQVVAVLQPVSEGEREKQIAGGIGVMNIMLVSVAERTKEIGLRRAPEGYINPILAGSGIAMYQGGTVGAALSLTVAMIIARLMNLPFPFSWPALGTAIGFSVVVVFSGLCPALRTAELHPLDALRKE